MELKEFMKVINDIQTVQIISSDVGIVFTGFSRDLDMHIFGIENREVYDAIATWDGDIKIRIK